MGYALELVNKFVWGAPALVMILGTGLFLSIRTRFVQLRLFPRAVSLFFRRMGKPEEGAGLSAFQALCTALAATVGTGNLVGVAGAIAMGGPGAVFWMWVSGILGMGTKYAEAALAVRYRKPEAGEYLAGPMYMIKLGLGKNWAFLGGIYSFFGVIASFGVGNATQINAVISSVDGLFGGPNLKRNLLLGFLLAVLIGIALFGGAKRIGQAAELLVPIGFLGYLVLCAGVLILRFDALPGAFAAIFRGAFSPRAVTGGAVGSAFCALRVGVSRGVFTNEAGMGTAAMAHGCARDVLPAEQGLMGVMEVFLDTIVMCTMTALVILCSGVPIGYGIDGGDLSNRAFATVYGPWAGGFLTVALCVFALATVLGWGLYGLRCAQYLFGPNCGKGFAVLQCLMVIMGAVMDPGAVWALAETVNGLMAIPNLLALLLLAKPLSELTEEYDRKLDKIPTRMLEYQGKICAERKE